MCVNTCSWSLFLWEITLLDEPCRLYLTGIHYNQEEYTYTLLQIVSSNFVCSDCSSGKMIHAMVTVNTKWTLIRRIYHEKNMWLPNEV
jgi:hypothetical protein